MVHLGEELLVVAAGQSKVPKRAAVKFRLHQISHFRCLG